jgi:hypothetical protein
VETTGEKVSKDRKVTMGKRIPMVVDGELKPLYKRPHSRSQQEAEEFFMRWVRLGSAEPPGHQRPEQGNPPGDLKTPPPDLSRQGEAGVTQDQGDSNEEDHRATERQYWEQQIRVTEQQVLYAKWMNVMTGINVILGLLIGGATLWIILGTLRVTLIQSRTALDALRSERPYISLGKADGTVAEYIPPSEGQEKGTILFYLQNSGPVAAPSFLVNVARRLSDSPFLPGQERDARHIQRVQLLREGTPVGGIFTVGSAIGANSVHVEMVDREWIPTVGEWQLIASGQPKNLFSLVGNFEYCDRWGEYYCEIFTVQYQPPPVSRFTATTLPCPSDFPPVYDPKERFQFPGYTVELLPRCRQPEERASPQGGRGR